MIKNTKNIAVIGAGAAGLMAAIEHNITYHEKHPEKETGQLFCDGKSQQIIDMLLEECAQSNVQIHLQKTVETITKNEADFTLIIEDKKHRFDRVIIATGGPSIP